jgi:hypothetical protein
MEQGTAKPPVHFWIVSILATLWGAFGGYDYVMSRTHNVAYLKSMMPSLDPNVVYGYMDSMPIWASIGWGLGVWGGLLGGVLLLVRSRHAVTAFIVSLIGMALSFGYQFLVSRPPAGMDDPILPLCIVVIGIGLFFYARAMRSRGVLG